MVIIETMKWIRFRQEAKLELYINISICTGSFHYCIFSIEMYVIGSGQADFWFNLSHQGSCYEKELVVTWTI